MTHSLKTLRAQFRAVGKFHTPPELALKLRSYIPDTPAAVYDPTCGAGALLSVFPDTTEKYGQDIDQAALEDAAAIPGMRTAHGDVLTHPAWLDQRFDAIVANPPFSIRWEPRTDERFESAPTIPTQSRADYAFLLHILHMLTDTGTAAVLSFPGVLYRGAREAKLRAWMVEQGWIHRVVRVPGDTFEDTAIETAILILRKSPAATEVIFEDLETGDTHTATLDDIRAQDYILSPRTYIPAPVDDTPPVDPWELEQAARRNTVRQLRDQIGMSRMVAAIERWPIEPFLDDLDTVLVEARATPLPNL
ncbi:HsdM family class I SAM-dependent methyltransferase [Pseudoglutamicibacter cumminsii]|uniref:HsdM family class I SAM-dependent methyltransferase n=1 Tax=Pseudoglutamicibacter cumminsii TaxID=156979 RepID=UPI00195785E9|nr:N-6 DNA methylase [Pseudoglutamicibacter cumminsii]MBM7796866.1 type I restriction enzyme M protein [Pseudoglutamicibacter cumminsii]